jgi:hypothetical protein
MREEYDFSTATKNPYAARLKQQVTIQLDGLSLRYYIINRTGTCLPRFNQFVSA